MSFTCQTYGSFGRRAENAQTDTAHKAHIHHRPMAKTRRPEIHAHRRRRHQMPPGARIGQKRHHQILQQTPRLLELHVHASGGVGRLLQEYGVTGDFADVDGDREALGGEDGVHDGDVLRGEVAADAEDEDAGG